MTSAGALPAAGFVAFALAAVHGARAADWDARTTASVAAGWASNPALRPGLSEGDRLAALSLSATALARTETSQFSMSPKFSAVRYDLERALDTNTGSFELHYSRTGERGNWTAAAQALVDSTLTSELGLSGISSINRRHESLLLSGGNESMLTPALSAFVNAAWTANRYIDAAGTGLNDYRYFSVNAGPSLTFSERLRGFLVLGADRTLPAAGRAQSARSASLRLGGTWSERTSWSLLAGATRVETGTGSTLGSIAEASASSGRERLHWTVSLRHDVSPIGYGLLARNDRASASALFNLGERSNVNLYVNLIRSAPLQRGGVSAFDGADYAQLGGEWRWRLFRSLDVSASASQVRSRSGHPAIWANGSQVRLGVTWQSRRDGE